MAVKTYFAIIGLDGKPKVRGRKAAIKKTTSSLYTDQSTAENQCTNHGDAVVRCYINYDEEPVFIRMKKVQ